MPWRGSISVSLDIALPRLDQVGNVSRACEFRARGRLAGSCGASRCRLREPARCSDEPRQPSRCGVKEACRSLLGGESWGLGGRRTGKLDQLPFIERFRLEQAAGAAHEHVAFLPENIE